MIDFKELVADDEDLDMDGPLAGILVQNDTENGPVDRFSSGLFLGNR